VASVKSYDLDAGAISKLKAAVELYGMDHKFTIVEGRFDYKIPKDSIVNIDPPYEMGNNSGHFNLSIENKPLYAVALDVLNAGAKIVFVELPAEFKWNLGHAEDNGYYLNVYTIPHKKIKIYAASKDPAIGKSARYYLVQDEVTPELRARIKAGEHVPNETTYGCKLVPAKDYVITYYNKQQDNANKFLQMKLFGQKKWQPKK
jgi:hypothetical protein